MELSYDPAWVASPEGRPLSLSLPINLDGAPLKGERIGSFFDNLLPDSNVIRQRIRSRFDTRSADAFDLLEAIGRDCVGALQLLPDGKTPQGVTKISVTPLDDEGVEKVLLQTTSETDERDDPDDFRISIAGAQEKTGLTWHDGQWCKPHGATPTTHLFKLPLGLVGRRQQIDLSLSLENEWLCAELMRGCGVPMASCEVKQFGKTKALIVERFDRTLHAGRKHWLRLPQEDFCQATGTPSTMKYEGHGGPGLVELARILQGSESREADLGTLLRAQLLFWMLAAVDGHAKNFSIRLLPQGRYRMTPLYDVLSAWPVSGTGHDEWHPNKLKLAMALRGKSKHYHLREIQRRHFNATAQRCGLGKNMEPVIADVLSKIPGVIHAVGSRLPDGFPEDLFERVTSGITEAAKQLAQMPST